MAIIALIFSCKTTKNQLIYLRTVGKPSRLQSVRWRLDVARATYYPLWALVFFGSSYSPLLCLLLKLFKYNRRILKNDTCTRRCCLRQSVLLLLLLQRHHHRRVREKTKRKVRTKANHVVDESHPVVELCLNQNWSITCRIYIFTGRGVLCATRQRKAETIRTTESFSKSSTGTLLWF